jgi:hypothetical protein
MHEFIHPHHVRTKNLVITSVIQHIFFTTIRNSKVVTARHGPSQLVMPQECTYTRFKSCKMTTKYFNHYIHLYSNIYFYAIQNSKLVTARRSSLCRRNVHFQVSSHGKWRQKNSIITSVLQHTFFTAIRNANLVTASCGTSQLVIPNQRTY